MPASFALYPRLPLALLLLSLAALSTAFPESTSLAARDVNITITGSPSLCALAPPTCGFNGDGDTYGIGIRIGVYTQWASSLLAYFFLPDEAASAGGVNTCFTLSNFIGLLFITFGRNGSPPTYAVECWIVLAFCLGGLCSGRSRDDVNEYPRIHFAGFRFRVLSEIPDMILACAILYYGIWFVFSGLDETCASACTRSAFFFSKVDLFHWFRTLSKVVLIIAAILVSLVLAYTLLCMTLNLFLNLTVHKSLRKKILGWRKTSPLAEKLNLKPQKKKFKDEEETERIEYKRRERQKRRFSALLVNIICVGMVVFFVLSVELMIKWNHITTVNTVQGTGQILPIVVGGAGFIRTVWLLINDFIVKFVLGEREDDQLESSA